MYAADWQVAETVSLEDARTKAEYADLYTRCVKMGKGAYMRQNSQPKVSALPPGWETVQGDPRVREYHYWEHDEAMEGQRKEGWVILFDQEPERLVAWISNAIIETSPDQKTFSPDRALALLKLVNEASNGQFPMVGLVWEDMEGTGHAKAYGFLDGLTVLGAPAAFYSGGSRTTARLDEAGLRAGLEVTWKDAKGLGQYARVASTTGKDVAGLYARMGRPAPKLDGKEYAAYVRETFIQAMRSTRNELLVAKALRVE